MILRVRGLGYLLHGGVLIYIREAEPLKSQQYFCLNKAREMTTSVNMPS